MADTAIAITAGTGTNVDTRTEATNGNHRQVIVIGDPATNAGVAPVDATTGLAVNVTNASLTVASHAVTNAGTFATQIVQGGNTAVVKPGSGAPSGSDPALVVGISPNSWDVGSGTSGTKTQRVLVDSSQLGSLGNTTMSASVPVTLASDQKFFANTYETVAASTTAQVMGGSGATGDYIAGVLVIPGTTSPANVLLLDNATSITLFAGGASSVSNLVPFFIPLGMVSASGAWKITTGLNVTAIGIGKFS